MITAADDQCHQPDEDATLDWQESFCMTWYDPVARIGAFHHTGLQRKRGLADAWCWFAKDGVVVQKYHENALDLPADDYCDMRLGPFHLRSERPLTHRSLTIDDRGFQAELKYAATTETLQMTYDAGGSQIARGHWENFGRVTGSVQIDGHRYEVAAPAFQDRSWGNRDWGAILAYRWHWATFHDGLIFSVYHVTGIDGVRVFGHVFDRGVWQSIRSLKVVVEMNSDGVTPAGSRLDIWLSNGDGYQMQGVCDGASVQIHRDNFMMANGCMRYMLGGQVGAGFIEVCERKHLGEALIRRQN